MRNWIAAAAVLFAATSADAAQIVLNSNSVVGSTGSLNYAGFSYGAGNIFNAQQGAIKVEQTGDGSHWLNPDRPGPAYITVDLGSAVDNLQFDLFNTHNGQYNNRGTGLFEIWASNDLMADGANGYTLGGTIATIVSGALNAEAQQNSFLSAQHFAATDPSAYRYIQFRAITPISQPFTPWAYGLNEMRVFSEAPGAVPEPATWAMMILGFGGVGASLRSRRSIQRQTYA